VQKMVGKEAIWMGTEGLLRNRSRPSSLLSDDELGAWRVSYYVVNPSHGGHHGRPLLSNSDAYSS
jgi:hypothetical protein